VDSEVSVREMLPGEERAVRELFKRSPGLIDSLFFLLTFTDAVRSAIEQQGTKTAQQSLRRQYQFSA